VAEAVATGFKLSELVVILFSSSINGVSSVRFRGHGEYPTTVPYGLSRRRNLPNALSKARTRSFLTCRSSIVNIAETIAP